MLVEIHMLQNHVPSNLNRDDTGSPKDCVFGGIRRARISSQCIKRSVRTSPLFTEGLSDVALAMRTRRLPQEVKKNLLARGVSEELAAIAAAKASGFGNKDGKEQEDEQTAQMMFLSPTDISAVADVLFEAIQKAGSVEAFKSLSAKDLQKKAQLRGWRPITPDIALFGRMITSDAFRDVDAAMQVAHAISANKMDHEFDYFTAVDDLQGSSDEDDAGAGMIGDVEFSSACYYKYFCLDFDALVANLAGPEPDRKADDRERAHYLASSIEARAVAGRTVQAFLRAAVFTTPSGKQNTFAAHQLPDGILVEVRQHHTPVSYANAFIQPSRAHGDVDLVADSLTRFAEHAQMITRKFSLQAKPRLWFTTRKIEIPGALACETLDDLVSQLAVSLNAGGMANG